MQNYSFFIASELVDRNSSNGLYFKTIIHSRFPTDQVAGKFSGQTLKNKYCIIFPNTLIGAIITLLPISKVCFSV